MSIIYSNIDYYQYYYIIIIYYELNEAFIFVIFHFPVVLYLHSYSVRIFRNCVDSNSLNYAVGNYKNIYITNNIVSLNTMNFHLNLFVNVI